MEDRSGVPVMVAGIVVAGLGAMFRYGLTREATRTVNFHTLGVIILAVGIIVLLLGAIVLAGGRRPPTAGRRPPPAGPGSWEDSPTRQMPR